MIDPTISQSYGFFYYYTVSLLANERRTDSQLLDRDADFVWRGVACPVGYATYINVRFKDANNFYFSSDYLPTSVMYRSGYGGPLTPLPVWPEVEFPAGAAIYMDWWNDSAFPVNVGLLFYGAKKFATPRT
jgi:hypothetical protein